MISDRQEPAEIILPKPPATAHLALVDTVRELDQTQFTARETENIVRNESIKSLRSVQCPPRHTQIETGTRNVNCLPYESEANSALVFTPA